ncbi:hypothetical protein TD95_000369 [Thielaviopsis punctulata]|uniref:SP-RING-type domain-containing protein n=1 Tax=Thielaviopsis punctulata TaxID=72032 RepID=A0A0F4ZA17_9PEZI|nr:hypothetical protein TD95_000369 [Thielaviopsis punctulata]
MPHYRETIKIALRVQDHPELTNAATDPKLRVYVFCATEYNLNCDIAFPQHSMIRVNGNDIRANLRGIKKRPGSTRPADITSFLTLRAGFENAVEFTYDNTERDHFLAIYVCKAVPVDELTAMISTRMKITKASVVQELTKNLNDSDIETTSQVLSLRCPLSYARMQIPCRGISCRHIQCFDATSYLMLQQQGPTWVCPVCNAPTPYDQLAIDQYVQEALDLTPSSVEQVTIKPDATWYAPGQKSRAGTPGKSANGDDADDSLLREDVVELNDGYFMKEPPAQLAKMPIKSEIDSSYIGSAYDKPAGLGVAHDSGRIGGAGAGTKRPIVIDLTLSDDEEDVQQPAKRVAMPTAEALAHRSQLPPVRHVNSWLNECPLSFEMPPPNRL